MPIRVLPVHLVNKIAAGEVIERPASVVKELVENALDAGATRIDLVVEDGGRKLLAVTDNGCGMDSDDLQLAFVPHATSKLADEDGLFAIHTMGFRGEALASIASISHAHIRTRRRDGQAAGYEIEASGETVGPVRPCASAEGTTITIRDLFFNTPARRKFLKTANTEIGHISEQLARIALAHPQVAFTLTHNGRTTQNLPAAESTSRRALDLFGDEIGRDLLSVRRVSSAIRIEGLIAPPAGGRSSTKWQYFFLNGRYIRDRLLSHALREAYRGLMDPSRSPVAFLFLQIDPAEVDVNVHPTKIEVRFRDSQLVHGETLAALRETLNRTNLTPSAELDRPTEPPRVGEGLDGAEIADGDERRQSLRQAMADFFKSAPPVQGRLDFPVAGSGRGDRPQPFAADVARQSDWPDPPAAPCPPGGCGSLGDSAAPAEASAAQPPVLTSPPARSARKLLQAHDSYIVCPDETGILIIDQHALHERLIYNDLKGRIAQGRLQGQRLLIPLPVSVTAAEQAMLESLAELLGSLGLEIASFGPGAVAIQQFPALLVSRQVGPEAFVRDLLDRLADDETTGPERLLEDVLEMIACKAAVKAGDPLTDEEIQSLLDAAQDAEKSSSCPHGRPTTIRLTLKDLEKQFKRA